MSEWRPVTGFDGYRVSDQGEVQSSRVKGHRGARAGWRPLKPRMNRTGYRRVVMYDDEGGRWERMVHHLVLEAFGVGRGHGMFACHWNDDRGDNRIANLRWASASENWDDRRRNGRTGTLRGEAYRRARSQEAA